MEKEQKKFTLAELKGIFKGINSNVSSLSEDKFVLSEVVEGWADVQPKQFGKLFKEISDLFEKIEWVDERSDNNQVYRRK